MVISTDHNVIPNSYEYNFDSRTWTPLTDVRTGIMQISISEDGSRLAFNSLNDGYLDLFLMNNPLDRRMDRELTLNYWAQRRASEPVTERVPATGHAMQMIERRDQGDVVVSRPLPSETPPATETDPAVPAREQEEERAESGQEQEPAEEQARPPAG